jgi:hypothetical protein
VALLEVTTSEADSVAEAVDSEATEASAREADTNAHSLPRFQHIQYILVIFALFFFLFSSYELALKKTLLSYPVRKPIALC